MLALSESSLGREVANWMPGRFSIRFFLAAGAFLFLLLTGSGDLLRITEKQKNRQKYLRNVTLFLCRARK